MPPSLSHLLNPGNVSSGVANYFLFAPVSWFANIQCPDDDSIIISEEHEFLPGKDWIKVITSPNTGEVNASTIGEIGSKKFIKKYKGFVPGTKEVLHASMGGLINEPVLILAPDIECPVGFNYQIGCDCAYAYCESAEFTTGTLKDGKKGYNVEFTAPVDKVIIYPNCADIVPTFNWQFSSQTPVDFTMAITNTTVLPPGISLVSQSITIFDELGNGVTTPPFTNSYYHDHSAPFLYDDALSPSGGAYYWIVKMTITCDNGCIRTAQAQIDGTTKIYHTIANLVMNSGTND